MNPPNPMNPTPRSNATDGTSNQWTPGPWESFESLTGCHFINAKANPDEWLAKVARLDADNAGRDAETAANARLVAAAPGLAECLWEAVLCIPYTGHGRTITERARAILARINGEGGGV